MHKGMRAHWLPTGVQVAPLPTATPRPVPEPEPEIEAAPSDVALAETELDRFPAVEVPPSWTKGQLLNVRNAGEYYVITLLGEEFDPRYPTRALKFTNPALCQNWVSNWYARENHDPRA